MANSLNILLKFPSRSRPEKFVDVLNKYTSLAKKSLGVIITLDEDDPTLPIYKELIPKTEYEGNVYYSYHIDIGFSGSKVKAINRDMDQHLKGWDILVLASDDMIPVVEGWDERIINDMKENFPDLDGVLYYYDGHQPLNTMPIMGRKAYEKFGYIYHPDYVSLWCDNEFEIVWDSLGKQVKYKDVLFEHQTWFNGKGQRWKETNDPLMKKNQSYFALDRDTFNKRKLLNFGL